MRKPKILLAEDHLVVAQALTSYLNESFDVVGTVLDGEQLLAQVRKRPPDVVISDIAMPLMSGMEALRQMQAEQLTSRLIFLTMHSDPALAREALLAGACGYVLKDAGGEELVSAIRQVMDGNIYVSSRIAREVMSPVFGSHGPSHGKVTPRQREVLQLVVTGRTMKEVAAVLNLSRRTVETHKYDMMESLGVRTTAELVQYAVRHSLVDNYSQC